jgi:hypothetical protein
MSNFEVCDADVHHFYIQNSLINIRYLVVVKTEFYPVSCINKKGEPHGSPFCYLYMWFEIV